jgi:hypothetical protein
MQGHYFIQNTRRVPELRGRGIKLFLSLAEHQPFEAAIFLPKPMPTARAGGRIFMLRGTYSRKRQEQLTFRLPRIL